MQNNTYEFNYISADGKKNISHHIEIPEDLDKWDAVDGSMWNFFCFLKAVGFAFNQSDQIGIMKYPKDSSIPEQFFPAGE